MKVEIVQAEVLVIGPEDRVLIKVPEDLEEEGIQSLLDHFIAMGLKERVLVLAGEFEITKVES